jgi:hypothetical protein
MTLVPAAGRKGAYVVARGGHVAYGLDGASGTLCWRCDGPGTPVAVEPANALGELPRVWFRSLTQDASVQRQALAVTPEGKYLPPSLPPETYAPPDDESWLAVPLPWEKPARAGSNRALLPALVCAVVVLYFAARGRWSQLAILIMSLLLVCLQIAASELVYCEFHRFPEFVRVVVVVALGMAGLAGICLAWGNSARNGIGGLLLAGLVAMVVAVQDPDKSYRTGDQLYALGGWWWLGPYLAELAGRFDWQAAGTWTACVATFVSLRRFLAWQRKPASKIGEAIAAAPGPSDSLDTPTSAA